MLCESYKPEHSLSDMLHHYKVKAIKSVYRQQKKAKAQLAELEPNPHFDDDRTMHEDLQARQDSVMDFFKMDVEDVTSKKPWTTNDVGDGFEIPPCLASHIFPNAEVGLDSYLQIAPLGAAKGAN